MIVVDADVDVRDSEAVLSAVAANMNPACDVIMEDGPTDPYDPAAPSTGLSRRMAIDATRKRSGERSDANAPSFFTAAAGASVADSADRDVFERVSKRWAEYGLGDLA